MVGDGPFLWINETGPPAGFRRPPPGGMCLSAFLFVRRGAEILLGKYGDDPRWEALAGLDDAWRSMHAGGWTIPARQVKFGEDPRDAARSIATDMLRLSSHAIRGPRVEVDLYESRRSPGNQHYDVWFLFETDVPAGAPMERPPWYAALGWHDPRALPASAFARGHQDVVARWLAPPRDGDPGTG
jgi:ADP-ribose pyrophosphatase YjhB (NUDIX family)